MPLCTTTHQVAAPQTLLYHTLVWAPHNVVEEELGAPGGGAPGAMNTFFRKVDSFESVNPA